MNQQYPLTKQQLIDLCNKWELELITGTPKPLSDIVDEFIKEHKIEEISCTTPQS